MRGGKKIKPENAYDLMFRGYPDVVNIEQLRKMLGGISTKNGYRLLKSGAIKSFVDARRYRIPKINVFEYMNAAQ